MNFINLIISFFVCCIEFIVFYQFFCSVLEKKQTKTYIKVLCIIGISFVLFVVNTFKKPIINSFLIFVLTLYMISLLFKGKTDIKLIYSVLSVVIAMITEFITVTSLNLCIMTSTKNELFSNNIIIVNMILSKFILIILFKIISKFVTKTTHNQIEKKSFFLIILPVISTVALYYIFYLEQFVPQNKLRNIWSIIIFIGLLISNIIVIYIFDSNKEKYEIKYNLNILRQEQEKQNIFYKQQEDKINEINSIIHDFKNHIICLNKLVRKDNIKVKDYINDLSSQLDSHNKLTQYAINNNILNIILSDKKDYCEKNNIRFDINIEYNNLSIISYSDTCAIFGNIIDNAIEACEKIDDISKRYINLKILKHRKTVAIIIINSNMNDLITYEDNFISSKSDGKKHGYGLTNMKRAVNNINGEVTVSFTDKIFKLTITIPTIKVNKL